MQAREVESQYRALACVIHPTRDWHNVGLVQASDNRERDTEKERSGERRVISAHANHFRRGPEMDACAATESITHGGSSKEAPRLDRAPLVKSRSNGTTWSQRASLVFWQTTFASRAPQWSRTAGREWRIEQGPAVVRWAQRSVRTPFR